MQARSIATRKHILEAAQVQFSRAGYNAASVDSICAQADISKGAFYHHFPSKQAVFLALLEEWLSGLERGFRLLKENSGTAEQALLKMVDILPEVLKASEGQLPIYLEFWMQASRDPKMLAATIAPYHRFREQIAGMVRDGIQTGVFRDVDADTASLALISLAIGLLAQGMAGPVDTHWPDNNRKALQLLLNSMTGRSE
jgi:AcrR family transcriptional regulator